jgi:hypothetical protein
MTTLSAEELLAGGSLTYEVEVPANMLGPERSRSDTAGRVRIKPLTVLAVQRVLKAAKQDEGLMAALILVDALVEPKLSYEQVSQLPSGLVRHLTREIQRVSGLATSDDELATAVQAPLARACFVLGREFGWTPQQVAELTLGQILLYLEMLRRDDETEVAV